jgi:hypothetical protein
MTSSGSKKWIVFGVVLPLAAIIGFCLASPDWGTLAFLGVIVLVMSIPLFLRWHHPMLILTWNFSATVFFLPGNPSLWILAAGISLGVTLLNRILDKKLQMLHVPSVTWTLLLLVAVVLFTMHMRGGLGLRALGGSTYGGKKYALTLLAILGYFALSSVPMNSDRVKSSVAGYFLSGLSPMMSQLVYTLGTSFWFLFLIFPTDPVMNQAIEDFSGPLSEARFGRLGSVAFAGIAAYSVMMARYGVRGILDVTKPWRLVLCVALMGASLMGGFRSILVLFALIFAFQFYFERLYRTNMFLVCMVAGALGLAALFAFAQRLPLSIQRSLSIVPFLEVNPLARADADGTAEWRFEMWRVLMAEVPQYLLIGKGNTASATDYYLAMESTRRGLATGYEMSLVSGDYHNGPLSVLVPFGLPGVVAFCAFLIAALRVLYLNYKNGDPQFRVINTFFLSLFAAKVVFFLFIFGGLHSDLHALLGLLGLSVSINRGVKVAPRIREEAPAVVDLPVLSHAATRPA